MTAESKLTKVKFSSDKVSSISPREEFSITFDFSDDYHVRVLLKQGASRAEVASKLRDTIDKIFSNTAPPSGRSFDPEMGSEE